jgi:hypothetical protein
VTKVWERHTIKAGFYLNHSYKAQNLGAGGGASFQGNISFANDTANPLDTGFGYANALLGVFTNYQQQSKFVEGSFLYDQVDWYVQDNWKVNSKLTLDFRLGGNRNIQFRIEAFNAFNTVVYNARNTTLQVQSPVNLTASNPQYDASGNLVQTRLTPQNAGFGAATGAQNMRSMQMQIRFPAVRGPRSAVRKTRVRGPGTADRGLRILKPPR